MKAWLRRVYDWLFLPDPQMELPFFCELYGDKCTYPNTWDVKDGSFYKRCKNCGVRYDPVCDR